MIRKIRTSVGIIVQFIIHTAIQLKSLIVQRNYLFKNPHCVGETQFIPELANISHMFHTHEFSLSVL